MEHRDPGRPGLKVSALTMGVMNQAPFNRDLLAADLLSSYVEAFQRG